VNISVGRGQAVPLLSAQGADPLPRGRQASAPLFALAALFSAGAIALAATGSAQSAKVSGAALFQQKGCAHCHSIAGTGGSKGPDLSDVGSRLRVPQLERQMLGGGLNMPPFRDALTPKEVHQLAGFLAARHSSSSSVVAEQVPSSDPVPGTSFRWQPPRR